MTACDTITLDVDLTNPGQFLACCGLLELACRVNPDAVAFFHGGEFTVDGASSKVLNDLVSCQIRPIKREPTAPVDPTQENDGEEAKEEKSPPVFLGEPFNFVLDWWEDESANRAGFKTWAAGMTIVGFLNGVVSGKPPREKRHPSMREHLDRYISSGRTILTVTEAIERPGSFNFDSRIARNVAIDLGFTGKVIFAFSPAVELLALIGLQRFRPRMVDRWAKNTYRTWHDRLPVSIASAVASCAISNFPGEEYSFPIKPRDAQGRYKAFGPAKLERSSNA